MDTRCTIPALSASPLSARTQKPRITGAVHPGSYPIMLISERERGNTAIQAKACTLPCLRGGQRNTFPPLPGAVDFRIVGGWLGSTGCTRVSHGGLFLVSGLGYFGFFGGEGVLWPFVLRRKGVLITIWFGVVKGLFCMVTIPNRRMLTRFCTQYHLADPDISTSFIICQTQVSSAWPFALPILPLPSPSHSSASTPVACLSQATILYA